MRAPEYPSGLTANVSVDTTGPSEEAPVVWDSERNLGHAAQQAQAEVLRFENAGARVGGRSIWRDLSFAAHAGELIAVLGPNGAGKSTLLKVALGLLPAAEGRVSVLGRPARRGAIAISYLPQRRVFDASVRIRARDLVWLGLEGTRWGVPLPGLRALWGGDKRAREVAPSRRGARSGRRYSRRRSSHRGDLRRRATACAHRAGVGDSATATPARRTTRWSGSAQPAGGRACDSARLSRGRCGGPACRA